MSEVAPLRVLLTGARGQVGSELMKRVPPEASVVATTSADLDITDRTAVHAAVSAARPHVIVNAAAYTGVDQAESDPARAFLVNREGAGYLAEAAAGAGARIIQLSTDFVFDGSQGTPYHPDAPASPLGVYGASKRGGEEAVLSKGGDLAMVLRTSWVYASKGQNFVLTMLRLMRERDEIGVVADQVGNPTWAGGLAKALWRVIVSRYLTGIHHWTDAGVASWYDFAVAIQEEALALGLLERRARVEPIGTEQLSRPARRPPFSVLDTSPTRKALEMKPLHWRVNLRTMLAEFHAS